MNKRTTICSLLMVAASVISCTAGNIPRNFEVAGMNIRNGALANIDGNEVIYTTSLCDGVAAHTLDGKELWSHKITTDAVLYEAVAEDIDGDGNDELLVTSANGTIYCWGSDGEALWQFSPDHKAVFVELAVVKSGGKKSIFVGGNDGVIYELSTTGKLLSKTPIKGMVRKLEAGYFNSKEDQDLFVLTYNHDKLRWAYYGILDAESKDEIRSLHFDDKIFGGSLLSSIMSDLFISDTDKDGYDNIIMIYGSSDFQTGLYWNLNHEFKPQGTYKIDKSRFQRYTLIQAVPLSPFKEEIFFQHGGYLYRMDYSGKILEERGESYSSTKPQYSQLLYAPKANKIIGCGEVDGGNGIYIYDLNDDNWFNTEMVNYGTSARVDANINALYEQVLNFKMPAYQQHSSKEWVMLGSQPMDPRVKKMDGAQMTFIEGVNYKENTDRTPIVAELGDIALRLDKRGKYRDTREEIVAAAAKLEAENSPFVMSAGHGNDPFYIQIETLEEVLRVAPNTCYGFIYAEMHNAADPRVIHFVREYMPRLAKAIRMNNKAKIYFRYKNAFWALTSHDALWSELFFSGKYADILVPASEDTSSRTQDQNLSGRVGMLVGGYVDNFAIRLIDDNPTSWRPLSPGGLRSISPYLRQAVVMAAYGAHHGVLMSNKYIQKPALDLLYGLMKSGVLPLVEPEDILSIGSWHLIKDVDKELLHSIDNHHSVDKYSLKDGDAVFSYTQMHWAGTSLPDYDYSKASLGVNYRWLNYMPLMPNGMVPVSSVALSSKLDKEGVPYVVSDGKQGFVDGKGTPAAEFGATMTAAVEAGGKQLPIKVEGASWAAIRIDEKHTRLIILDPNYIYAQDCTAKVTFQGAVPKGGVDILSSKKIKTSKSINIDIPAGSMRFIDFEY